MIDTVENVEQAIEIAPASARERLRKCLPVLQMVMSNWRNNDASRAPANLTIAAATERRAVMLTTQGFTPRPEGLKQKEVIEAVVQAIEAEVTEQSTNIISAGISWLIGEEGQKTYSADAEVIESAGLRPLIVALLPEKTMLITAVGMTVEKPTLH